jgi:hypothetical protein
MNRPFWLEFVVIVFALASLAVLATLTAASIQSAAGWPKWTFWALYVPLVVTFCAAWFLGLGVLLAWRNRRRS